MSIMKTCCDAALRCSHVIVRGIADSFAKKALGLKGTVDLALARKQHSAYVEALKSTGVIIKSLEALEEFPDGVFVEDPAIIIMGHALMTRPGDSSRLNETKSVRKMLAEDLKIPVIDIQDQEAKLDGGDVLFTGREILVGLSKRTNERGVQAIREAFPALPVTPIQVSGPLHLKTLLGMCAEDTICASLQSGDSVAMLERIDKASPYSYRRILVPDDAAANTIFMNGTLICKSEKEAPNSFRVFKEQIGPFHEIKGVDLSEIEKAVGSLTCMSLRFSPPKSIGTTGGANSN